MKPVILCLFCFVATLSFAQSDKIIKGVWPAEGVPTVQRAWTDYSPVNIKPIAGTKLLGKTPYDISRDPQTGAPIQVQLKKGEASPVSESVIDAGEQAEHFYAHVCQQLKMPLEQQQSRELRRWMDQLGKQHVRLQQTYQGLDVFGKEVIVHFDASGKPVSLNGRFETQFQINQADACLDAATAEATIKAKLKNYQDIPAHLLPLIGGQQWKSQLVIYENQLCWQVEVYPNVQGRYIYFVEARDGEIVHFFRNSCQLHHTDAGSCQGIESDKLQDADKADARNLFNQLVEIDVFEHNGDFFLIDASRPMFNAGQSNIPNDIVGGIVTLDARDVPINNSNFEVFHITDSDNNWNNPKGVSAHFNAGQAYEYFRNTFNRNSINGGGGTIFSVINVTEDGNGFDNAFWNGQAMFYGNGRTSFSFPLQRSLDVGGHEMSHGVIENTANLVYENQSGALNESYADIFGVMIDRDDWKLGEDIVNNAAFPSGALRDMQNPNNGGTKLGDRGWQPKHMDEFQDLPNTPQGDFGGVHINSGIPNRAFFLFATSVGKEKAEQVYYHALVNKLVRSSRFIDLRIAIIASATELYGQSEADAAASAFDQVGIFGSGGGGGNYQQDLPVNPGRDWVLYIDDNFSDDMSIANGQGAIAASFDNTAGFNAAPDHRVSMSDDGTVGVFAGEDGGLYAIFIDWQNGGAISFDRLSNDFNWRHAAISKDGNRLAAVFDDFSNGLFIYDFVSDRAETFNLYNPTTQTSSSTGDVDYADVLEWDYSGTSVMYDARNVLEGNFGDIIYWDIGFMRVWNTGTNNFGDGRVSKLFSGLPEDVSVGNPTFAKNSPYIVAFDFIDNRGFDTEYSILGTNIEEGEVELIFENNTLGVPNYSRQDNKLIFDFEQTGEPILGIIDINSNKISGDASSAVVFVESASQGTWFSDDLRDLTLSTTDKQYQDERNWQIVPNPATDMAQIMSSDILEAEMVRVYDVQGRLVYDQPISPGSTTLSLPVHQWNSGTYIVQLVSSQGIQHARLVKQ